MMNLLLTAIKEYIRKEDKNPYVTSHTEGVC